MKILESENNVSYTANNACKIYVIKQVDFSQIDNFIKNYSSIIGEGYTSLITKNTEYRFKKSNILKELNTLSTSEKDIKLVPLITFPYVKSESRNKEKLEPDDYNYPNELLYESFPFKKDPIDAPIFGNKPQSELYFLKSLIELRNCPLLDLSKFAFVFQIEGQTKGGLANVLSFSTTFSVNGQSSAEIVLNNKDFLYNFKYFDDKSKYTMHLKSYFDTNDIIIIRQQKKNLEKDSLLSSFKQSQIDYWKDPYIGSKIDPFSTIFTGYINDVNSSFSFSNGQQTLSLICTGPSKKLTWTRFLSNKAAASRDSASAILPFSAFVNPQTQNEKGESTIKNSDVIKYVVLRTYSGVNNIPELKKAADDFIDSFDKNNNIKTYDEIKNLREKLDASSIKKDSYEFKKYKSQIEQKQSELNEKMRDSRNKYNKILNDCIRYFVEEYDGFIGIRKHNFIDYTKFGNIPYLFEIRGTDQPAYQWTFNNYTSLFQSDFSTVYQFIKNIADNLQFNFYDDPYGTIHFSVPDMTLLHLNNQKHPNNLNQIINFSETQSTENIANVQPVRAKYKYNLNTDMINSVAKDYRSIQKYGEKLMQPFEMTGLTEIPAIRYAAKMRMAKYNRKALSNIRITLSGEPNIELDKYAYIKSLRKLFYIESYSHSYNAGGDFITSLNGTYTRDILALANFQYNKVKIDSKITAGQNILSPLGSITKQSTTNELVDQTIGTRLGKDYWLALKLQNATSIEEILDILDQIVLPNKDILAQKMYQIYIDNWNYPKDDENLKLDIGAMYTEKALRQCFLDGFFWALPFDVDPYSMAIQIQEDEKKMKKQLSKTETIKTSLENNIAKNNKDEQNKIVEDNKVNTTNIDILTKPISKQLNPPKPSDIVVGAVKGIAKITEKISPNVIPAFKAIDVIIDNKETLIRSSLEMYEQNLLD